MQPTGNLPNEGYRNTFKNGPAPQPSGAVPNVNVGRPGPPVVVQTGDARTDNRPHAPKPGP